MMSLSVFSQTPLYSYQIKLQGVTDSVAAVGVADLMKDVFRVKADYNNATGLFDFSSPMSINETGFEYQMRDEGYRVTIFEKKEFIKEEK